MERNQYIIHEDYCELRVLYLNEIKVAKISLKDIPFCQNYTWHYHQGYLQTSYNGRKISLHILLLGTKENQFIDHINRDKLDNRRENLRFVSRSINSTNAGIRSDKTQMGLPRGVNYSEGTPGRSYPSYNAQISINGKRKVRTFSCHKYGKEKAKELAIKWREERLSELKIQSAPYESME